jgi:hypothetical protein
MNNKYLCLIAGVLSLVAVYPAFLDYGIWGALVCFGLAVGCGIVFFIAKRGK